MKKILFEIKQFIIFIIRSFYALLNGGQNCIVCGSLTGVVPVCKSCSNKYFNTTNILKIPRCKTCGKVLVSTKDNCMQCREEPVLIHTDQVIPLFPYLMWYKEILFLWKINEIRSLSSFFAKKVYEVLVQLENVIVIPVPPRPGKIKQKGWDQIDELCSFLQFRYGIKILKLLQRNSTQQQKKLDRKDRLEKINSAYTSVDEKKLEKILKKERGIMPETVCLIDDVSTTGATLEKCAALLKEMGVKKVVALTIFTV